MASATDKSPLRNGLRDITMAEYWRLPLLVSDTLEQKLLGLPIDPRRNPELSNQILDTVQLLRAVGTRAYGEISLLAMLDVLLAVDRFLVLHDQKGDSLIGGYDDDAQVLAAAFEKHKQELDSFRRWRASQP